MTILSAIQNVSAVISLNIPSAVFSSSEREHIELQILANACASHIARDYEWQSLKFLGTLTGNGADADFDLPADYDRMLKEGNLWSNRLQTPLIHITSTERWLELQVINSYLVNSAWTLLGNKIQMMLTPGNGETIVFYYMSNKWAKDESGVSKSRFSKDTDSFRLSEELLELCMIWKWKSAKKLPYAQEKDDYEDLKEKLITADKGARILRVGRVRAAPNARLAYPTSVMS